MNAKKTNDHLFKLKISITSVLVVACMIGLTVMSFIELRAGSNRERRDAILKTTAEIADAYQSAALDATSEFGTSSLIVETTTDSFDTFDAVSVTTLSSDYKYLICYKDGASAETAYHKYQGMGVVKKVEPDSLLQTGETTASETTEDATINGMTSLRDTLNEQSGSKDVIVAILDTGIDATRISEDRVIDSKINVSASGDADSIADDNGHGTEIASVIATNSNAHVKLLPIKIADANGHATMLGAYYGIQNAILQGADVINLSMNSCKSSASTLLADAIHDAVKKGIHVVVSAGNNGTNVVNNVPANLEDAVVVSAVNNDLSFATYSNYGVTVDYCTFGSYGEKTGTSYASAYVAGVFGDLLSKNMRVQTLDDFVMDLGDAGRDDKFGKGFVYYKDVTAIESNIVSNDVDSNITDTDDLSVSSNSFKTYGKDELDVDYCKGWVSKPGKGDIELGGGIQRVDLSKKSKFPKQFTDKNGKVYDVNAYNKDKSNESYYCGVTTGSGIYDSDDWIKFENVGHYIDADGKLVDLDAKVYVGGDKNKCFTLDVDTLSVYHFNNDGGKKNTHVKFEFYNKTGKQVPFKCVFRFTDIDKNESVTLRKGCTGNLFAVKNCQLSLSGNCVSGTKNTVDRPDDYSEAVKQDLFTEMYTTAKAGFEFTYTTDDKDGGMSLYYKGCAIKYYVDGKQQATTYCVPYGAYTLLGTSSFKAAAGYHLDTKWYNSNKYTTSLKNTSIMPNDTLNVYTKSIANTYTVKFSPNGGTGSIANKKCVYGTKYTMPSKDALTAFKRVGYHLNAKKPLKFNNKTYAAGASFLNLTTQNGGVVTVDAQWDINTSTIKLDPNGGTLNGKSTVASFTGEYNMILATGTPIRKNYVFVEWIKENEGSAVYVPGNNTQLMYGAVDGDVTTFSANWYANTYTITLNSGINSQAASYSSAGTPAYYEWYSMGNYADAGHASVISAITIPKREGYYFGGYWSTARSAAGGSDGGKLIIDASGKLLVDSKYFESNSQLYARWTPVYEITLQHVKSNTADVYYEVYGVGTYQDKACTKAITRLSSLPSCKGYGFDGYYDAVDGGTQYIDTTGTLAADTTFQSNTTLYAHWIPVFKVTLDPTANEKYTVDTVGTSVYYEKYDCDNYADETCLKVIKSIKLPTKKGYTFGGYFINSYSRKNMIVDEHGKICNATSVTSDVTAIAKWTPIAYTVKFDGNLDGGKPATSAFEHPIVTGSIEDCETVYDSTFVLPTTGFTRTTYSNPETNGAALTPKESKLLGWGTNPDATIPEYAPGVSVKNLTAQDGAVVVLYAIWDDHPEFLYKEFPDRYFTLDDAINGDIDEDELLSSVKACDRETTPLVTKTADQASSLGDIGITLYNFDASDFTSLTAPANISLTYKVKDEVGNLAYMTITVYVTDVNARASRTDYVRSISESYYLKDAKDGGLNDTSKWRRPALYSALGEAFGTNDAQSDVVLSAEDLKQRREAASDK